MGGMDLTAGGFAGMAARLRSLARGRVVFALEGGYKPSLAAKGVLACVRCAPPPPLYRTPRHYVQQPAAVVAGHHLMGSVHAGLGMKSVMHARNRTATGGGKASYNYLNALTSTSPGPKSQTPRARSPHRQPEEEARRRGTTHGKKLTETGETTLSTALL